MLRWMTSKPINPLIKRGFRTKQELYFNVNPLNIDSSGPKSLLEFSHISSAEEKLWLEENFSSTLNEPLSLAQKLNTLKMIQMGESFEQFLHKKFGSYKRYSGQGTESLVPCLYGVANSYHVGGDSIVLTIAHRGKLSVLVSLMNYPLRNLFFKVKGGSLVPDELNKESYYFVDDIATHIAVTTKRNELKGLKVSMLHNPSHLEIGGAVGMGKTRAKIDKGDKTMHVWVHGDAAMSGQGVVYELTQMAHLDKFSVGGTLHIVANNQLGFTATESMGRSSNYCTDIFKIIEAPIVHVNALSVEDVVKCANLGVKYRNKFKNDFAIDLVGYRKFGHNEVDDPTFTNPLMYKTIKKLKSAAELYAEQLISEGVTTAEYFEKLKIGFEAHLNKELNSSNLEDLEKDENGWIKVDSFREQWKGFSPLHNKETVQTGYVKEKLIGICNASTKIPEGFKVHPILARTYQARNESVNTDKIDWATAEILAFGSLMQQGYNIRLCGEDSIRGTFSQRQIGVYCQDTEKFAIPLASLGKLTVVNSILSELGVVGFEYGYSLDDPKNLVLWEAQFGDFSNMAQPITDTYIATGEAKWLRQSGLILLLPHGQEAQGPDHSSAQLERYLGLVNNPLNTQMNLEVVNMIVPSNYFHLLRMSVLRNFRRPIVIGTPKSALRNKWAVSKMEDFEEGSGFKPVIYKDFGKGSQKVVVCNGKVYLDLINQFPDISILLVEQLAPLPFNEIQETLRKTRKNIVWVQEEPKNFGVFNYIRPYLEQICGNFEVVARTETSANAVGNSKDYKIQQEKLFQDVARVLGC